VLTWRPGSGTQTTCQDYWTSGSTATTPSRCPPHRKSRRTPHTSDRRCPWFHVEPRRTTSNHVHGADTDWGVHAENSLGTPASSVGPAPPLCTIAFDSLCGGACGPAGPAHGGTLRPRARPTRPATGGWPRRFREGRHRAAAPKGTGTPRRPPGRASIRGCS
jgi:hypothetical protein